MTITGGSALPKDDIDRMIKDAETHEAEDKARREEAEVRNSAEQLVFQTEKFVKDNDEKLPDEPKQRVGEAIDAVKKALEGTDIAALKSAVETLATESQQLGSALYAQQQSEGAAGANGAAGAGSADGAAGAGGTGASGGSGDDDIVDAEIVDDADAKGDNASEKKDDSQ